MNVTDQYIEELKDYAIRFFPGNPREIQTQRELVKMVDPILPIDEIMLSSEVYRAFRTDSLGELSSVEMLATIACDIERWSVQYDESSILNKISNSETEVLLRCWIALAFYKDLLKPEYCVSITKYYHHLLNEIFDRDFIPPKRNTPPIFFDDGNIHIDSRKIYTWMKHNPDQNSFRKNGVIPLTEKEPIIALYDDGNKTREYCLQTEANEDFTGKYFIVSTFISIFGDPLAPALQIDGFVSDTPDSRAMKSGDIGYRMEAYFLTSGGEASKQRYEMLRGQDLISKALKYQGYTTPSNVRLIGVCPDCKRSFSFHEYSLYMMQIDVAYSDDGLDCCEIRDYSIDKDTWKCTINGKTFRYYNSFNCPHCGSPYIDYKRFPENKVFGVSGCVHLGRKLFKAE